MIVSGSLMGYIFREDGTVLVHRGTDHSVCDPCEPWDCGTPRFEPVPEPEAEQLRRLRGHNREIAEQRIEIRERRKQVPWPLGDR